MRLTPTDEQEEVINALVKNESGGTLLASQLGTGKTLVAVETAIRLGASRILVACPLSTVGFAAGGKFNGWIGTFVRQGWDLPIRVVTKREHVTSDPGVYIIGREFLAAIQKDTKTDPGIHWAKVEPFDVFVYDEVHQGLGNRTNKILKSALTVRDNYRIAMSGTPFRTKFANMWAICRWAWHQNNEVVPRSYWSWVYKWCRMERQFIGGGKYVEQVVGEKDPGAFVTTLPSYHRVTAPTRAVSKQIYVILTGAQRAAYNQMEATAIAWLNDHKTDAELPLVARIPLTKKQRLREMTLGLPEVDGETISFSPNCPSSKMDALEAFLKEHEGPVLVGTHSAKFATAAAERLGAALWTGGTSTEQRAQAKADFLSGKSRVLVATIRSFGTGTDGLQDVCDTLVFLSRDDSDVDNYQFIGRLDRHGQKSEHVTVVDLIAHDTFDEGDLSKEAMSMLSMHNTLERIEDELAE